MNEGRSSTGVGVHTRRILAGLVPAATIPFLAALAYFVVLSGGVWTKAIYAAAKAFTVLWPVAAVALIEGGQIRWPRHSWRKHLSAIPAGVASGMLIGGLILAAYMWTPLGGHVQQFSETISSKVGQLGITEPAQYVAFGVFLAGVHSLIEEYFWRWYVFGRLVLVAPLGIAYPVAGLSFAAHHYVLLWVYFSVPEALAFGTAVGVGGVLWCWMFARQGTLAGAWISHAIVDLAILYVGYGLVFA